MSEKLTRLRLPGSQAFKGIMDWGEREADDMIRQARSYADHMAAQAREVHNAADTEFQIDIVRGSHVQHHVRTVQEAVKQSLTTCEACNGWGVDDTSGFKCPHCGGGTIEKSSKVALTAPTEARNYPELPVSSFLREAAAFFEKQPTNGEDRAHWANVHNAQNCRNAAHAIEVMHSTLRGWLAFFHGDATAHSDEAFGPMLAETLAAVRLVPSWKRLRHAENKHGIPRKTKHAPTPIQS